METTEEQVFTTGSISVKEPLVHTLENGFIRYVDEPRPTFHLYGLKGAKPIYLNSKELIQLARDLPMLQAVASDARSSIAEHPTKPDEMLFSKTLYKSATSEIKLSVDIYKGKPYIWAKRFYATDENPANVLPCKGGTHFGLSDTGDSILKFVQQCLFCN